MPDAPWVAELLRASGGAAPMKWRHVSAYITQGAGAGPDLVRQGLASQVIVVTDVMAFAREFDLSFRTERGPRVVVGLLMLAGPVVLSGNPEQDGLVGRLRTLAAAEALERSGVGAIDRLRRQALSNDLLGELPGSTEFKGLDPHSLARRVGGSLAHAAKLASQSTVLIAHELAGAGREDQQQPSVPDAEATADAPDDFAFENLYDPRAFYDGSARRRLRRIGAVRAIVDAGEEHVTVVVDSVRAAAAAVAPGRGGEELGYVRVGTDLQYLRLQIADVAAGYARTLLSEQGAAGLVKQFRTVLYKGKMLDAADAARLDRDRVRHRQLLANVSFG